MPHLKAMKGSINNPYLQLIFQATSELLTGPKWQISLHKSLDLLQILLFSCVCLVSCFSHAPLFVTHQTPCPGDSLGKNTRVGCHALLQEIFPTQGSNPHLLGLPELTSGFFTTSTTWEVPFGLGLVKRKLIKLITNSVIQNMTLSQRVEIILK